MTAVFVDSTVAHGSQGGWRRAGGGKTHLALKQKDEK